MKLTKQQRIDLQAKFDGLCAYCGSVLGKSFHADHLDPVLRQAKWVSGRGYVPTGGLDYPERDALDNLMPACASIDKSSLTLEQWRTKLSQSAKTLLGPLFVLIKRISRMVTRKSICCIDCEAFNFSPNIETPAICRYRHTLILTGWGWVRRETENCLEFHYQD